METITVKKLRIYAMLMLMHELEQERLLRIKEYYNRSFAPEPMILKLQDAFPIAPIDTYNSFTPPKSKYHK